MRKGVCDFGRCGSGGRQSEGEKSVLGRLLYYVRSRRDARHVWRVDSHSTKFTRDREMACRGHIGACLYRAYQSTSWPPSSSASTSTPLYLAAAPLSHNSNSFRLLQILIISQCLVVEKVARCVGLISANDVY